MDDVGVQSLDDYEGEVFYYNNRLVEALTTFEGVALEIEALDREMHEGEEEARAEAARLVAMADGLAGIRDRGNRISKRIRKLLR